MRFFLFFFIFAKILFADENEIVSRIDAHILIEDYKSALEDAKKNHYKYPHFEKLKLKYIECLALDGNEIDSIVELKKLKNIDFENEKHDVLENISWAILNRASDSSQYTTRLTSLIGAHITQDVRAINILRKLMNDSNAIIRTVALQLASSYMDKPLKDTVKKLYLDEKIWLVRLEVIKAIGKMKIAENLKYLKEIIASEKSTFEEKEVATQSLVNLKENISYEEIEVLAKSPKAGLRKLACDLVTYFNVQDAKGLILTLINDPITDVRISALNSVSLNFLDKVGDKELKKILQKAIEDSNPTVAITACYLAILKDYDFGKTKLKKYLYDEDFDNARLAANVLSRLVNKCFDLKEEILKKHFDIYVKANVAIGLVSERKLLKLSADTLFDFLKNEKGKLFLDDKKNSLFQVLLPSHIRHIDQIPNYPEAIDQMTRLQILSMLSIIEDARACEGIKDFLKYKSWGITGFASATLLKEGDEQCLNIVRTLLDEKDQQVKVQAALVLALLGKDETVISTIEKAYQTAEYNMKLQILEATGHIASKKSIKFLINALDEPYQNLRVAASSSLIKCINS